MIFLLKCYCHSIETDYRFTFLLCFSIERTYTHRLISCASSWDYTFTLYPYFCYSPPTYAHSLMNESWCEWKRSEKYTRTSIQFELYSIHSVSPSLFPIFHMHMHNIGQTFWHSTMLIHIRSKHEARLRLRKHTWLEHLRPKTPYDVMLDRKLALSLSVCLHVNECVFLCVFFCQNQHESLENLCQWTKIY